MVELSFIIRRSVVVDSSLAVKAVALIPFMDSSLEMFHNFSFVPCFERFIATRASIHLQWSLFTETNMSYKGKSNSSFNSIVTFFRRRRFSNLLANNQFITCIAFSYSSVVTVAVVSNTVVRHRNLQYSKVNCFGRYSISSSFLIILSKSHYTKGICRSTETNSLLLIKTLSACVP